MIARGVMVAAIVLAALFFTTIAFAALPLSVRLHSMAGQYLAKIAMTVVSIPLVYWARSWTARMPVEEPITA